MHDGECLCKCTCVLIANAVQKRKLIRVNLELSDVATARLSYQDLKNSCKKRNLKNSLCNETKLKTQTNSRTGKENSLTSCSLNENNPKKTKLSIFLASRNTQKAPTLESSLAFSSHSPFSLHLRIIFLPQQIAFAQ